MPARKKIARLRRLRCDYLSWFLGLCSAGASAFAAPGGSVDFNRDVRPILTENCYKCHGPDEGARKSRLRLDVRGEALKPAKSGQVAIVPGSPAKSEMVTRITASDPDDRMPPLKSSKKLSPTQIEILRRWVAQGAPYAVHWAYVKPVRPALPEVRNKRWVRNPVDRFILARLEHDGLRPSPEADGPTLIRRVSLDLTGLPPTLEQVDAFLADQSERAYENLVERLLKEKAFGEHWARMWLDLARYADSAGYADDPPRTIWAYRDYVIRAFNSNKPFDRFTLEQIAGDLLADASEEDLVATAFHRNTMTNNEGGTNDEEFRNAAVVDRVNTTMAVWMATSMGCAQCHTHKYDPISQTEYFQFFALLNNTEDADKKSEEPVLKLWTAKQKEKRTTLEAEIAELQKKLGEAPVETADEEGSAPATNTVPADATPQVRKLASLREELRKIRPNTVPIMHELAGEKQRRTKLQFRGNYLALGDEVPAAVPAAFHPLPAGRADRLALAKWLVDENNPLTARVLANRLWEQVFGIGIVRTSEDFGSQGDPPTHPELLDWLATEMVAQKWDMKAFLKLLVTSAAYRQSSRVTPELLERDPENLLLARGPRFRMGAEMVRDQTLEVSGLLSHKMNGPPVRPPQPALGLTAAFGGSLDWKPSEGEDRYRRGLYIEWRRTNPYASMATFDAPNREVCALRRPRSNTPLQALVTLNDPVYLEAAQALAQRMEHFDGQVVDKVRYGFRLCLARPPRAPETRRLCELYEAARANFDREPEKGIALVAGPQTAGSAPQSVSDLAAWTTVANVLLNLDEMMMKR